jgi:hypothetical protein
MLLSHNEHQHFPFLGQGREKNHCLYLRWNNDGGSSQTLESNDHTVNLLGRVLAKVEANVKGPLKGIAVL